MIDENLPFNQETQDKLGFMLLSKKRPIISLLQQGKIEEAQYEMAKEFASIPVPPGYPTSYRSDGTTIRNTSKENLLRERAVISDGTKSLKE